MTENWRPIPGYEGRYEASDHGRVRSLDRALTQAGRNGTVYTKHVKGRVLRPGRMSSGHLSAMLGREGGSRCVHELVLLTFRGPAPEGHEARHRNGAEADNRLGNLVWDTRGNNSRDKKWHRGQSNYKLRPEDVRAIRRALSVQNYRGIQRDLAAEYSVSECAISRIKLRQVHVDVES